MIRAPANMLVTNFLTDKSFKLDPKDSDVPNPCSSPWWSVKKCLASMKSVINQSWNAMLMSEKNFTLTLLWAVEQLCSLELLKDWANKWPLWPHQPWKLKSWLLPRESSLSGSVDQFFPPSLHSRLCGSAKPNIKRLDPALSTENASDRSIGCIYLYIKFSIYSYKY